MTKKLFCPNCGAQLNEGDQYCVECGKKWSSGQTQESVETAPGVETVQERILSDAHVQSRPEKNEEIVLQCGEVYYFKSGKGIGKKGTLLLTDRKLTFTAFAARTELDMEFLLKDVEKVKSCGHQNFFYDLIGVYLKDKQYVFTVKKKEEWLDKINNAVNAVKNSKVKPTVKQGADYIDEIKRLKELADAGIITEREFEAKKKSLLGL